MKKYLIIFEGPGKFKTILKYKKDIENILGGYVTLEATGGHFLSTSSKELGIDIKEKKKGEYEFNYKMFPTNKQKISQLKTKITDTLKSGGKIIIATDWDRAGEMIAKEIVDYFKLKKGQYERILLSSIEKKDFLNLIGGKLKGRKIDSLIKELYEAEETRMILDKMWGYIKSPILWERLKDDNFMKKTMGKIKIDLENKLSTFKKENKKILNEKKIKDFIKRIEEYIKELDFFIKNKWERKELFKASVGRVQLPMNKLIINKWFEKFKKVVVKNKITIKDKNNYIWNMNEKQFENIEEDKLEMVIKEIKKEKNIIIKKIDKKEKILFPKEPLNETSLVSEANTYLGLSPKIIADTTQKLYEKGLTTYYRTPEKKYTESSVKILAGILKDNKYKTNINKKHILSNDEKAGHDAIRITHGNVKKEKGLYIPVGETLTDIEKKVYDYIYRRSLSTIMEPLKYKEINITGTVGKYNFEISFSIVNDDDEKNSFVNLYTYAKRNLKNLISIENIKEYINKEAKINIKDIILEKGKFQFKESIPFSTFKKELENKKIGTPATFISIFEIIKNRNYIDYDGKNILPKLKGIIINEVLSDIEVNNLNFTDKLLEKIEEIEKGKYKKSKLLNIIFEKYFKKIYNS